MLTTTILDLRQHANIKVSASTRNWHAHAHAHKNKGIRAIAGPVVSVNYLLFSSSPGGAKLTRGPKQAGAKTTVPKCALALRQWWRQCPVYLITPRSATRQAHWTRLSCEHCREARWVGWLAACCMGRVGSGRSTQFVVRCIKKNSTLVGAHSLLVGSDSKGLWR